MIKNKLIEEFWPMKLISCKNIEKINSVGPHGPTHVVHQRVKKVYYVVFCIFLISLHDYCYAVANKILIVNNGTCRVQTIETNAWEQKKQHFMETVNPF